MGVGEVSTLVDTAASPGWAAEIRQQELETDVNSDEHVRHDRIYESRNRGFVVPERVIVAQVANHLFCGDEISP